MTWVFKELLIREENPFATKDAIASEGMPYSREG